MSLPNILRHTRDICGLSQLDLAAEINVSQRHISFLESGRARPSRELLLAWMHQVNAPASIRNAALLQAGYAPAGTTSHHGTEPKPCLTALKQIIAAYQPFPGFVLTSEMTMAASNRAGNWLFSLLMPELWQADACGTGLDMISALAHPNGLLSKACDGRNAALAILEQLRVEAWLNPCLGPRVNALADFVDLWPEDPSCESGGARDPNMPISFGTSHLPLCFKTVFGPLSFLRVQAVFEMPQDVTIFSLRVELWLPNDEHSREVVLTRASVSQFCAI